MENVLVTGGCGFIGTNFIRYLLEESDFSGRIINADALTYAGNPENLTDIKEKFSGRYVFVKADICDRETISSLFHKYEIDTICHFAAETHVDRSIPGPEAFVKTNIVGTFNLLELARGSLGRMELFHHVSTDEVFGSLAKEGRFTEKSAYKPNSPYSASKAGADHLVRAYHQTYGLPVTISNCSNNYGPFQFPEKLIPRIVLNALEGRSLPVYGDGGNVRDWLYVRDHCIALWEIMKHGRRGEMYNIGGNNEIENIRLVKIICSILDEMRKPQGVESHEVLINFVEDRPGHDRRYAIDFGKLRNELGWEPRETFDTGIRKTIRWYVENQEWANMVRRGKHFSGNGG